jgi:hypothetical protein
MYPLCRSADRSESDATAAVDRKPGDRITQQEDAMRILKVMILFFTLSVMAFPLQQQSALDKLAQGTEDLGLGAFENQHNPILMAVDASLADLMTHDSYVMFVVYMASKDQNQGITVARDGVVMIYKGQEYHLPTLAELRKNYNGTLRDLNFYRHLGKEGVIASWVRFYNFPERSNFFPAVSLRAPLPVDQGYMYGFAGFRTPCYFKNPGFRTGDELVIRVSDKNNPKLVGQCAVRLD